MQRAINVVYVSVHFHYRTQEPQNTCKVLSTDVTRATFYGSSNKNKRLPDTTDTYKILGVIFMQHPAARCVFLATSEQFFIPLGTFSTRSWRNEPFDQYHVNALCLMSSREHTSAVLGLIQTLQLPIPLQNEQQARRHLSIAEE